MEENVISVNTHDDQEQVALMFSKYNFLIRQLVARDFKTKYKRSVLGMLWSFLNPLLTMSIQYVVFSTIFRSTIPNFIIYLLCGIICFKQLFNTIEARCQITLIIVIIKLLD